MPLTREQIDAKADAKIIEVPAWGGSGSGRGP